MDPTHAVRSSGLPKSSRLPHRPSSRAVGGVDGASTGAPAPNAPSTTSANASALPRLPKRSSIAIPPSSAMRAHTAPNPFQRNRQSMLVKPGFQAPIAREMQEADTVQTIVPTSPQSPQSNLSDGSTLVTEDNILPAPRPAARKPRPSLSDRTLESLSMVPPSPSPAKRRQSGFFSPDSPMKPPSRAESALGSYSRPGSRVGTSIPSARPASPSKVSTIASNHVGTSGTPVPKRPMSSTSTRTGIASNRQNIHFPAGSSRLQSLPSPTATGSKVATVNSRTTGKSNIAANSYASGNRTVAARPTGIKSPIKDMFGGPLPSTKATTLTSTSSTTALTAPRSPSRLTNTKRPKSLIGGPSVPRGLKNAGQAPKSENNTAAPSATQQKLPGSSQSLRETIAAAKAAHRAASGSDQKALMPRSIGGSTIASIGPDADPETFGLADSAHVNIIKKRINIARKDGKLNVAALCLKEMPSEVLKLYEHDPNDPSSGVWYEDVDLTRLMAADNEFEELPAALFPSDVSQEPHNMTYTDEVTHSVFAGLTDVDLHGNALRTLPSTMGNLSMLTTLNLSRNQLGNECLETIGRIKSLKELRLAENKLADVLPDSVSWLEDLIILDLQKNSITELPSSLGRLSKLSKLNVSTNRLSSIPFEAIFDLNITEIVASRNQLDGYLLPSSVPSIRSLKALDISTNRLLGIAETAIELPALITLEMANNRVSELPSVASWLNLITLNAEENKLSAFPEGFTKLHNLQSADFGNNSLLSIDDGIGDMVGLASLNIKNNPIKERRLPRLTTHELKAELRSRRPLIQDSPTENGASSEGSPLSYWPVRDGVLDRSNTRLQSIDKTELEPLTRHNVNSMLLHHNQLPKISPAIELLGETLVSLDLSYNKLGKTDMYLTECLTLPNLHTLNLTSNALISLDPLVNRLTAPKLETLIFSFNRIKTLPALCEAFPALSKLIASNNAIGVLDVDSVRGLRVLDVSSNEIESLPPRLAVLQGQLRTLVVTGNRFRVPGYAILQKGTEEVLKWLRMKIPAGEEGAIRPEMEKQ